jgi:hypothetical protein
MIKRKITTHAPSARRDSQWLRLEDAAEVEITSESAAHPIEAALVAGDERGWEADAPGEQTICLRFPEPRGINQVRVVVEEHNRERTQQFILRAATGVDGPWREIARQQYNFSPAGATREQEDYRINLPSVTALELTIVPDINGGEARASLQEFRVG